MVQVSLVGYGAAGAFLGLAYFDLLFNLYAMVVLNRVILERRLAGEGEDVPVSERRRQVPTYGQPHPDTTPAAQMWSGRRY
jgi:hypothetical protein